jgi:hypothetical protein
MTFILAEVRDSFQHPGASAKYTHVAVVAETVADLGILCSSVSQPVGLDGCDMKSHKILLHRFLLQHSKHGYPINDTL